VNRDHSQVKLADLSLSAGCFFIAVWSELRIFSNPSGIHVVKPGVRFEVSSDLMSIYLVNRTERDTQKDKSTYSITRRWSADRREQPALKLPAAVSTAGRHHPHPTDHWPLTKSTSRAPGSIKQSRNCRAYSSFRPTDRGILPGKYNRILPDHNLRWTEPHPSSVEGGRYVGTFSPDQIGEGETTLY